MESWKIIDLKVGQSSTEEITINGEDLEEFARLSGDVNPLHTNDDFAKQRGFKRKVVHGALLSSYVSRLLGTSLPGRDCFLHQIKMRYIAPVYVEDTIKVSVELTHISESIGALDIGVNIKKSYEDIVVAKGQAQVGLTKEVSE